MLPTPYDMRWTSNLICRDLKGLANQMHQQSSQPTLEHSGAFDHTVRIAHQDTPACAPPHRKEVGIEPLMNTETIPDATTLFTVPLSTSGTVSHSNSTLPTEVSQTSQEGPVTLYSLVSQILKDLYASRGRDLPHIERWIFRGAWLILHMVTQYCASNPTHDVLNPGSSRSNEIALLLEVLQYSTSTPVKCSASRVSQMPTMPFTKSDATSRRNDSVHDTISMKHPPTPTSALLWYTIFIGATDRTKTVQAADYLLEHISPEKNASAILEIVGNPAKRLSEDDNTGLRKRLGLLLYP